MVWARVLGTVFAVVGIIMWTSGYVVAQKALMPSLTDEQELGRRLISQACVVCHFPLQRGAHTYGPRLSRESLSGNEDAMRTVIAEGTPRMPGFKHMLDSQQIGAIVQYIKTLAPAPPPAAKTGE